MAYAAANKVTTYGKKPTQQTFATLNNPASYHPGANTLGVNTFALGSTLAKPAALSQMSDTQRNPYSTFTAPTNQPNLRTSAGPAAPQPQGMFSTSAEADPYSDPAVAMIAAAQNRWASDVEAQGNSAIKQALIQFGYDPSMSDVYPDSDTAGAAQANANSVLAQLLFGHQRNMGAIDQNDNAQNIFYSSTRGNHLQDEDRSYLGNRANAQAALYQALQGYQNQILQSKKSAQDAIMQAILEWAQRNAGQPPIGGDSPRMGALDFGGPGVVKPISLPGLLGPVTPQISGPTPRGVPEILDRTGPTAPPVTSTSAPRTAPAKKRIQ